MVDLLDNEEGEKIEIGGGGEGKRGSFGCGVTYLECPGE